MLTERPFVMPPGAQPPIEGFYFTTLAEAAAALPPPDAKRIRDPRWWVRGLVAWDPDTDVRALWLLSLDDPFVQLKLAVNRNLPPDLYPQMVLSARERLREKHLRRPPRSRPHQRDTDFEIMWRLLGRANCPPDLLLEMGRNAQADYELCSVLTNPRCPAELVSEYARRPGPPHPALFGSRPLPTPDLLSLQDRLPEDKVTIYLANLARRPWREILPGVRQLPPEQLAKLAALLPEESVAAMSRDADARLRCASAGVLPDRVSLVRLGRDPDSDVRRAATHRMLELVAGDAA